MMSTFAPYVCTDMKIEGEDASPQNSGDKKRNMTAVWMSHLWSALFYHSGDNYYDNNTVTLFEALHSYTFRRSVAFARRCS